MILRNGASPIEIQAKKQEDLNRGHVPIVQEENYMGYTAYAKMRKKNKQRWNVEGPALPEMFEEVRFWEKDASGKMKSAPSFKKISSLEKNAILFIRESCEGLRFDRKDEKREALDDLDGRSLKENQVPYNFEMDMDRRCLEVAIHRFIESGMAKEAFDVYFCYLEMFIGAYGKTKKMIEMLSEFEANASSLLMKHRDHYSHSVYVFLIGLAFYYKSESFRRAYREAYGNLLEKEKDMAGKPAGLSPDHDHDLAAHFLKYWGLTSLFHDIGYPFELSFEQIKSYFGNTIDHVPFVTFNMNGYQNCGADENPDQKLKNLSGAGADFDDAVNLNNLNAFLAYALYGILGEDYAWYDSEAKKERFDLYGKFLRRHNNDYKYGYQEYLYEVLCLKPKHPEEFGGFIDHAYFSAITLLKTLMQVLDQDQLGPMHTQAITAILLHNSLYKFAITNYKNGKFNTGKHFNLKRHPLAWLLMLCDELQCWDRTSYGQNSRGEIHPFDCSLEFEGDRITATYLFDRDRYYDSTKQDLKDEYAGLKGTYKKLCVKEKEDKSEFLTDIENIISINGDTSFGEDNGIELVVGKDWEPNRRYRKSYLSTSNFIHMYKFAVLVHKMNNLDKGSRLDKARMDQMENDFEEMSLEYKINHISRAKKFSKILGKVDCFYSDQPMDCEVVTEFGTELEDTMGPAEHERWCWEHYVMGWRFIPRNELEKLQDVSSGNCTRKIPDMKMDPKQIRECIKLHPDLFEIPKDKDNHEHYEKQAGLDHYRELADESKHGKGSREKDTRSINNLLTLLSKEDGVKVYRLRDR